MALRSAIVLFGILCAAASVEARQSADAIARDIVIGQAYRSGRIIVAGFVEEDARPWPQTLVVARLLPPLAQQPSADFVRRLDQDDPEAIAHSDVADAAPDFFAAMDGVHVDRPAALYGSRVTIAESVSVIGWSGTLGVRDISYQNRGQLRPVSSRERDEIAADKRKLPKGIACTTEPRWIDSAKILLTARITSSNTSIRLSSYQNPGCLGHLSTIYVLDVMTAGREPRRFEFRHHEGVL
jgi:hypothetical protein